MSDSVAEMAETRNPRRRRAASAAPTLQDRLPPFSHEAEQGVLGCILLAPLDCTGQCLDRLPAGVESFYDLRHQTLYRHLVAMYDQREPADQITLGERLKAAGELENVGGHPYLSELQNAVPSAANLSYYTDIVHEKHQLRRLLQVCTECAGRVYDHQGEVADLLDEAEREVLSVRQHSANGSVPILELTRRGIELLGKMYEQRGSLGGLATGFADLDRMTDGMHGGEMIVVAARPSIGKTSLGLNIAEHVALNLGLPVGIFSLEMTADELVKRIICSMSRVNMRSIRDGFMSDPEMRRLTVSSGRLSKSPLFIDDSAGLSIMQLRARARRMWQQHEIKLFVVDYLQLLHATSPKAQDNRQIEIAEISSGIKSLAKELNVPILVMAQLNREIEKTKGRKPQLSHLRESGAIEQDADVVGLLYKPGETDAEQNDESDGIEVNLYVAKQRNGPTGDVHFTFLRPYTRFESAARVSDEDVPEGSRSPHND